MGSPEPLDQDENNCVRPQGVVLQVFGHTSSDDSDNENINDRNNGYQPLPLGDGEVPYISEDDQDNDMEFGNFNSDTTPNNQLDRIVPADVEIETQVWNTPRPEVLNIELDTTKSEQVTSVLTYFFKKKSHNLMFLQLVLDNVCHGNNDPSNNCHS